MIANLLKLVGMLLDDRIPGWVKALSLLILALLGGFMCLALSSH
jgi:hypothetical protein